MPANTLSTQAMTSTYSCQCYWMLVSKVKTESTKWKHQIHRLLWIRIRRKSQLFGIVGVFASRRRLFLSRIFFFKSSNKTQRNVFTAGFLLLCAVIGTAWRRGSILPEMRFPACVLSAHFKFIESVFLLLRLQTMLPHIHAKLGAIFYFLVFVSTFPTKCTISAEKLCQHLQNSNIYIFFYCSVSLYLCLPTFVRTWTLFFNALWSMTLAKWKLTRSRDCAAAVAGSTSSANYKREHLFNPMQVSFRVMALLIHQTSH